MADQPIRLANFSGYFGDRFTAVDEVLAGDPVDVLVGDYLAEITLAALAARHLTDPDRGYVEYFVDQLRPHLATLADRRIRVVTNAGGFNPAGLAAALRDELNTAGVGLRVAHVEGDNIASRLTELQRQGHRLENLDTGQPLSEWPVRPIAANAYLGGWGIARALGEGADIVVCGRVTDASLTVGPAAWWHSWRPDDWDRLAGAVLAGHIIECGPQAVGGNFSGFTSVEHLLTPGFPIAEVAADGSSVITKHAGDDGAVTVDTVTAQLVYEIQGPRYLNPDVTVHLDDVRLTADGPDRVRVDRVTGSPPPPTTKVAIFGQIGYQQVNTVYVTAPGIPAKVELLRRQLERVTPEGVRLRLTTLGTAADDPETQWDATVAVRILATAADREALTRLGLARLLGSLYLQSYPGYFTDVAGTQQVRPGPRIEYWPGLLKLDAVGHRVVLDERVLEIAAPEHTAAPEVVAHPEPTEIPTAEPARRVPLGTVAHARSGDKGGNCNVGIWTPYPAAWPWLRAFLSTEEIRRLVPEVKDLDIVRHEFPELRAVHFVFRGLLGTGGSANDRVDQVGKAVGEYLRATLVPIPPLLLDSLGQTHDAH
ncbi:acyclic terpene utilization AtuA family protein [Nocardia rhamnosiphila]|uniref:acyclic terpene utilization AtuA family protein n=1 Tax=Nocardia rhamnosiphila TaxID=426716 RepID=UPI00379052BB